MANTFWKILPLYRKVIPRNIMSESWSTAKSFLNLFIAPRYPSTLYVVGIIEFPLNTGTTDRHGISLRHELECHSFLKNLSQWKLAFIPTSTVVSSGSTAQCGHRFLDLHMRGIRKQLHTQGSTPNVQNLGKRVYVHANLSFITLPTKCYPMIGSDPLTQL